MPDDSQGDIAVLEGPLIVGVGASAGGLEAFQELLTRLPERHTLAVVLVQHLDPHHESMLPELLSKRTSTPVRTAEDGMKVEGGNVYVISPGQLLTIKDGFLRLTDFSTPRGLRRPIDAFLDSLARDAGPRSVAIILSGTGSDGSNGIRAVKEAGGLVFVQDPKQADYDGMPRSAIETGADDMVLPTQDMIDVINDYFSIRSDLSPAILSDAEFIARVAKHVRFRTGHDFSGYKQATLLRRLAVRMSVLGLSNPNDYLKALISNKSEASKLFRDLLINVTSFFRDRDAFMTLQDKVMRAMVENRGRDDEIRVWVPGCSTGQEAYTLGILLSETVERTDSDPRIAIFATDIDEDALKIARRGLYPNSIVDEVPQNFLSTYFTPTADGFEVSDKLRDLVRFSNQSIIKDPPFSRIDLVSCRNVTIYFEPDLQDFALSVFHYALKEGGTLFLGPSETPRSLDALFTTVDSRLRIYQRRPGPSRRLDFPAASSSPYVRSAPEPVAALREMKGEPYARALLTKFAPAFLLLDRRGNVTYTSEKAARYLRIKPGTTKLEITQLILPELESAVRRLVVRVDDAGEAREQEYRGEIGGDPVRIVMRIEPLEDNTLLLVIEDRLDIVETRPVASGAMEPASAEYVRDLEIELDRARETIRTTVEELETSNEELKSSNEEMMSMNEELQSANEELSTTNEELQDKVLELRISNEDMANLMRSTRIVTVFLDDDLRIRFFTPESRKVFRFVEGDRGRPLADIGGDIDMEYLLPLCQQVLEDDSSVEQEIGTLDGSRQYILKIEPYAVDDSGRRSGVVLTMTDVTALRQAVSDADSERQSSQRRLAEIEQLYLVSPQAMALLAPDSTYLRINRRMAEINGMSIEEHVGKRMIDVVPDLHDQVTQAFKIVLEQGEPVLNRRIEGRTAARPDERRLFSTDWYPVTSNDEIVAVGVNVRDITEQTEMSAELRRMMQELQHRVKNMLSNVLALVGRARREAKEDATVFDTLAARIRALSNTHKILTEENWRAADIHTLLTPELTEVYGADRVTLKGPALKLNARAAVAIGMAVHELATNAAKYGAFSRDGGSVTLTWKRLDDGDDDRVYFNWVETGGPKVTSPGGDGFGSQLIRSTITGSLQGKVEIDWRESGLSCEFSVPHKELSELTDDVVYDLY